MYTQIHPICIHKYIMKAMPEETDMERIPYIIDAIVFSSSRER